MPSECIWVHQRSLTERNRKPFRDSFIIIINVDFDMGKKNRRDFKKRKQQQELYSYAIFSCIVLHSAMFSSTCTTLLRFASYSSLILHLCVCLCLLEPPLFASFLLASLHFFFNSFRPFRLSPKSQPKRMPCVVHFDILLFLFFIRNFRFGCTKITHAHKHFDERLPFITAPRTEEKYLRFSVSNAI